MLLGVTCLLTACKTSRPQTATHSFRVMTYNIHHGEGLDGKVDVLRIAELIRREAADIVALQEVDKGVERTARRDLLEELAALTATAGERGGFYHSHVRYPLGDRFLDPFREAIEIGRRAGTPSHITHFYHRQTHPGRPDQPELQGRGGRRRLLPATVRRGHRAPGHRPDRRVRGRDPVKPPWPRQLRALLLKDLRLELRTRDTVIAMALFAVAAMVIFQFAMSPFDDWKTLAWAGALLITLAVLVLNILARTVFRQVSVR